MIPFLVFLLFIAALFFIFVPILPPGLFVFAAYLIYAYHTDFTIFNSMVLIVIGFFSVLSLFIDNVISLIGAKVFKGSTLSIIGMFIGMISGFMLGGPLGMIIGIFAGAFLGEFVNSMLVSRSLMVAIGTLMGYFIGLFTKIMIIGGLITYFVLKVFIFKR